MKQTAGASATGAAAEVHPATRGAPGDVRAEGGSALDSSVLVLNRLYAAIRITNARRALLLLYRHAAEVVTADGGHYSTYDFASWILLSELLLGAQAEPNAEAQEWVHTPRLAIAIPRVIRLLAYAGRPPSEVRLTRRNIYARDRGRCHYCGKSFPSRELTIDHVVPRSLGGKDQWENLVSACSNCNARKGGRTPQGANMRLLRRPERPRSNPIIAIRMRSPKYESWRYFLDDLQSEHAMGN